MGINLRWVGEDQLDRVAETRLHCYAGADSERERYQKLIRSDGRAGPGDFLLAESNGDAVGTATSLSMTMWVRGNPIPCQGVAWVGTIKTHRRSATGGGAGIASQIMHEALNKARERKQVVSALMPFRVSFYEHFGYGIAERRNEWTVPLSILPKGNSQSMRYMKEGDLPLVQACRQSKVQRGQCDIERTPQGWTHESSYWPQGYCVVDQTESATIQSWMQIKEIQEDRQLIVVLRESVWNTHDAFMRQLHFLSTLRDQFTAARMMLPLDLPLNRLLKEAQLEHRAVEHATARCVPQTRMQVRILDHVRFLEALKIQSDTKGQATIAVRECEGSVSSFKFELDRGRMSAKPTSGQADIECTDSIWASIACGDISATSAAGLGLIRVTNPSTLHILDTLAIGPAPFCNEYF